jgi:hypothetical protein
VQARWERRRFVKPEEIHETFERLHTSHSEVSEKMVPRIAGETATATRAEHGNKRFPSKK